ncbi:MAG: dephospho-CoA kinase [Lagierella massiliensis]|nr:dephospho-CoA kinase [Lagierella massiliensis]
MNQNNRKFVITGGVACGKSTIINFLKNSGFNTFSSDEVVHNLYKNVDVIEKVQEIFQNEDIVDKNFFIDRKELSRLVFNDGTKRRKLERLIHPLVIEEIVKKGKDKGIIFFEIPLYSLIEESLLKSMPYDIISVDCNEEIQINRLIKRQSISREKALQIISVNKVWRNFKKTPTKVIRNDGDLETTLKELKLFLIEENLI